MTVENPDDKELNEILAAPNKSLKQARLSRPALAEDCCDGPATNSKERRLNGISQWTTGDNKRFIPAARTCNKLTPAAYEIQQSNVCGIYFEKIPVSIDGLVRFPQANTDRVLREIQNFWERDKLFQEYNLTHKRGIFMWGPAGSGKSSCIKFVMKDVIEERGGIVIKFGHPKLFIEGMRIFREIEPTTPAVILMEDIDAIIHNYSESEVLNILDGVDKVEKLVFLATSNYPEQLGARIVNRPSRFDKRFKIGHPNAESRLIYLKHIICDDDVVKVQGLTTEKKRNEYVTKKAKDLNINLTQWVKDTKDFSIAHLKELFVAVVILGDNYEEAVNTLRSMKDFIKGGDDQGGPMGFNRPGYDGDDEC